MAEKKVQGKKGSRKVGRNIKKCATYKNSHRREVNKIKRVTRSNGTEFSKAYAAAHGVTAVWQTLERKRKPPKKENIYEEPA